MQVRHITLFSGIAVLALGGAYLGHKYYGRIMHRLFGPEKVTAAKTDDLYNPDKRLLKRGRRDHNVVCLTIDDGPHPSLHRILPILKKYGVHATFFMVGSRLSASPVLVRQVLAEGHEIGNHTQNHERLDQLPIEKIREEVGQCEASFEKATGGSKMTLFRPPGMDMSPNLFKVLDEYGYTTVGWSYGAKDYILPTGGPNKTIGTGHIAKMILAHVTPGGIILLHDSDDTADELPMLLEGLKKKGFAVETASQMLADLPTPVIVKTNAGR